MIVSFNDASPLTVYRTASSICDVVLAERGATMAELDRTDLAVAEAVELLFAGGSVISVRVEPGASSIALSLHHDGSRPSPGVGTTQLFAAACTLIEYDEHLLRLTIEVEG